jgi:hypothetical protein
MTSDRPWDVLSAKHSKSDEITKLTARIAELEAKVERLIGLVIVAGSTPTTTEGPNSGSDWAQATARRGRRKPQPLL